MTSAGTMYRSSATSPASQPAASKSPASSPATSTTPPRSPARPMTPPASRVSRCSGVEPFRYCRAGGAGPWSLPHWRRRPAGLPLRRLALDSCGEVRAVGSAAGKEGRRRVIRTRRRAGSRTGGGRRALGAWRLRDVYGRLAGTVGTSCGSYRP